jgi:hypothetical protein
MGRGKELPTADMLAGRISQLALLSLLLCMLYVADRTFWYNENIGMSRSAFLEAASEIFTFVRSTS